MVYSRGRVGTRSLIKTAVLCALSLSVIPSARADGSLSTGSTAEVCEVSDGDKNLGIRIFHDPTCVDGGLGCQGTYCRFCKILETPQSSAFTNCSIYGEEFPTMAPLVVSTGACEVSSGDAAVGISAFTDVQCLYGGLGCFNDHCRFCKVENTTQSEAFVDCPGSGSGSFADVTVGSVDASTSGSADPNVCPLKPATGDVDVGISIGTDATCASGGLGCINDVCRFCRVRTTDKSAAYPDCELLGTSDVLVGAATTAPTVTETPSATTEAPAVTTTPVATTGVTDTPAATSGEPATTEAPLSSTIVPDVTTAAPANVTTCSITPSVGDAAVGVNIVTDARCQAGGLGCIDKICRFCKVTTTSQSASYLDCATLFDTDASAVTDDSDYDDDYSDASDVADGDDDASTPAETPATPDATTAAPAPDVTTAAPAPDATTTAPAPAATTAVPDATTAAPTPSTTTAAAEGACTQTVTSGDAAVGIKIVTDTSCSTGGLGCIDNVCRYCQEWETKESAHLAACSTIGAAATTAPDATTAAPVATTAAPVATTEVPTPVATTAVPDATTETPVATDAASAEGTCTQTVTSGDAAVGIKIVTDTSCSAGGLGCIDTVCRFCKQWETSESSTYLECSSLTGSVASAEALSSEEATPLAEKSTLASAIENIAVENPAEIAAGSAACVGVVAAVVAVAIAAKRSRARSAIPSEPIDSEEDPERGERASPSSTSAAEVEPIIQAEA